VPPINSTFMGERIDQMGAMASEGARRAERADIRSQRSDIRSQISFI